MHPTTLLTAGLAAGLILTSASAGVLAAQQRPAPPERGVPERTRRERTERALERAERLRVELEGRRPQFDGLLPLQRLTAAPRAVIGVALDEAGSADTAGVRIAEVRSGGPAERAGLRAGDRIIAVDGRDVRLTAAEAADPAQRTLGVRRVTRTLGEREPGEAVTLTVRAPDGAQRTARLTTVSPAALAAGAAADARGEAARAAGAPAPGRGSLGLSVQASGTVRDTLGVFVARVVPGGPAEAGGIVEGDRIARVGDVDVRVRAVDAADPYVARLKADQLERAIAGAAVGEPLRFQVWRAGSVREVRVAPRPAAEVYREAAPTMRGLAPGLTMPRVLRLDPDSSGAVRFRFERDGAPEARGAARRWHAVPHEGGEVRIFRFDRGDGEPLILELDPSLEAEVRARVEAALRDVDVQRETLRERERTRERRP